MQLLAHDPKTIEKILVAVQNPMDTNKIPMHVSIADNKENSKTEAQNANETVQVFTNSSSYNNKIGAAAVLLRPGQQTRMLHYHLGLTKEHDNYEAKLAAILLGLHLIKTEKHGNTSFVLRLDNQVAIKALTSNLIQSEQSIALNNIKLATKIHDQHKDKNYLLMVC